MLNPPPPPPHDANLGSSARFGQFGRATRCARSTFQHNTLPDFGRAFGISSVGTAAREGHRKTVQYSSTFRSKNDGIRLLIIPWSQVRVLAGPPSPLEIIGLWPRERGTRIPWCEPLAGLAPGEAHGVGEWVTDTPLAAGADPTRPRPGLPLTTHSGAPPRRLPRERCRRLSVRYCGPFSSVLAPSYRIAI